MSVTIRLARTGRKNLPSFKMVVSNTKDKRNGRYIDILGHYNPSAHPVEFSYDKERYEYWRKNGSLISDAVKELVEGKYVFKPYVKIKEETRAEKSSEAKPKEKAEVKAE